ncbi:glucose 1-dehydrogenase [Micrococcales bacterium 31B]|nr:glucose 1-dehydrogenase [Micrococcales bacterium 31B]
MVSAAGTRSRNPDIAQGGSVTLFDLTGRTALITGSSRGIGRALAGGLLRHGANVIINGRDAAAVADTAATLAHAAAGAAGTVYARAFDVTDPEAAETAVADLSEETGGIDILINNTGMQHRAPVLEFPLDAWNQLFTTNVTSAFIMAQVVGRRMKERGAGKIINIASVQSELARPGIAPYTATKGAMRNLTRGLCTDLAQFGIQVNAIAPGYFDTELTQALVQDAEFTAWVEKRTPAGRWGQVEDLVGAAVFFASDASSFVNGQVLHVDGGMTVCL